MSYTQLFIPEHDCKEVEIEVTNKCNAKCVHCPASRRLDNPSFMSVEMFRKIISKYSAYYSGREKPSFIFAGGGEPLLNQHLEEFIRLCTENGFMSSITTNAQLLHAERLKGLIASGVNQINISIHAIKPEEYRMAMNLDYEVTMKNILSAHAYLQDNKTRNVGLSILCNELSLVTSEKEEIEAFWQQHGIAFTGQKPIWNRAGNLKEFDDVIKDEKKHIKTNFEIPVWCLTLKYMDIIDSEGHFIKCSCDYFGRSEIYGSIEHDQLDDIYSRLDRLLTDDVKPEGCRQCIKSHSNVFFDELSDFMKRE